MEGIVRLFRALIVSLVALGAVLAGLRRRPPSVEDNPGHCSSCVFSVCPGCSCILALARHRRVKGVTLPRLTDFERSRSSIRCHFLRQIATRRSGEGSARVSGVKQKYILGLLLNLGLAGCVIPKVTQEGPVNVDFSAFKTVAFQVHATPSTEFDSDRGFGDDEIAMLNVSLAHRLQTMGYAIVAEGQAADLTLNVAVTEAKRGSTAARLIVGLGAGRAVLAFDAAFKDSRDVTIASFQGGESFVGTLNAARFAGDDDIKQFAVTRAVKQITEFMLTTGVCGAAKNRGLATNVVFKVIVALSRYNARSIDKEMSSHGGYLDLLLSHCCIDRALCVDVESPAAAAG
jgi:hypothetical protein